MIKIAESNLTKAQLKFLKNELNAAIVNARNKGISIPHCDIILTSNRISYCDTGTYREYAERQRNMQAFDIKRDNSSVLISGGAYPGVMYGLYTLLKNQLGIRWYGLTEEDIRCVDRPVLLPESESPEVPLRGIEGSLKSWSFDFIEKFMLWMARNGWNQLLINAKDWLHSPKRNKIREIADLCGINLVIGGHSFELFLPDQIFAEKPHLFGMRNGVRCISGDVEILEQPGHKVNSRIQPCLSNPECAALIAQNAVSYLDSFKEIEVFSLWPHDGGNNWCQCPLCLKRNPYELMHELAQQIVSTSKRKIFIEILAYSNLLKPPENLSFEASIYTLFCPYLRSYSNRLFDTGFPVENQRLGTLFPKPEPVYPVDDREYGYLFKKWLPKINASGGALGVFAYYQLVFHDIRGNYDRSRYLLHPSMDLIHDELRYFINHGMLVYYDCSWPYPGFWPDGRLYSFYSRLLWNCNSKPALLINEYNKANENIVEFLDRVGVLLDSNSHDISDLEALTAERPYQISEHVKLIEIWLDYVKLAMKSFSAALQNKDSKVIEYEEQIIRLFEDERYILEMHVSVDWMINYSKSVIRHNSN
jgi:hypothetical protein